MIRAIADYIKSEVRPRVRRLLWSSTLFTSLGVAAAFSLWGGHAISEKASIGDVGGPLIAYASIALGFSIAGLTLAISLPDRRFVKALSAKGVKADGPSHFSDLLFVFSWNALVHLLVVAALLLALLVGGPSTRIVDQDVPVLPRAGFFAVVWIVSYGFLQFLITAITISQVGVVYVFSLRHERWKRR